jgi:thiol-disulfide isomerase/thioredoxin
MRHSSKLLGYKSLTIKYLQPLTAMQLKRLLQFSSIIGLLAASPHAQGQIVRYRTSPSPKLQTQVEVDSAVKRMDRRGKSAGYEFHARILKTTTRTDTIIHDYILTGTHSREALLAHEQSLSKLVGQLLPAFTLPDLQGKPVSSRSLLGKPVVLNLWFTSCGPCLAETPVLNRIRSEKAGTDIVFLAVTFESKEKVQAFLRAKPFTFRHLVGAKAYCDQVSSGYPTSIFVDRSGIIRSVLGAIPVEYDPATAKLLHADDKAFYAALTQIE